MNLSDFDFELPEELIASHPLPQRDASRMLVVNELRASSPPVEGCGVAAGWFTKSRSWLNHPGPSGHPSTGGELALSTFQDKHITDFISYLQPSDVVVFNNSKVIPARFDATAADDTKYEITLHTIGESILPPLGGECRRIAGDEGGLWWGFAKKFQKLKIGEKLKLDDDTQIEIMDKNDDSGLLIKFHCDDVFDVLDKVGKMPLPPYMKREEEEQDRERYQTVYAQPLGSMAAPTAGLHFTPELIAAIEQAGAKVVNITLHVGAGTWLPVKVENLAQHKMHSEWGVITPEQAEIINSARRVIAVGTTSLRLLESAANSREQSSPPLEGCGEAVGWLDNSRIKTKSLTTPPCGHPSTGGELRPSSYNRIHPFCGTTDIFITPGYQFKAVDVLLTNFHLPKSTLFMLVSAFAGLSEMKTAYAHAILEKYRFFSYGDCCLLFKKAM